ncbi:MAG TPA: hypothetical protein VGC93_16525 [Thermoanaerobaculia bacterium]
MSAAADLAAVTAAAVALLWGCGLLLARLLLPRRYRPFLPLVAPFLGFALLSALGHYLGVLGQPLRAARWLFVALAAAGWVAMLWDRRLRRLPRASLPAVGVCLLAFLLAVMPLLALGYLTTIGATIDGLSYAVRSEYLQAAPLRPPATPPGKPFFVWVLGHIQLLRVGDVYVVGILAELLRRRSYELLTVVPALFFALTAGSVFVWARAGLGLRRGGALLAAALAGTSNLLLWPVYDNFLSQVIGVSFLPLLLCVGIEAQRRRTWRRAALFGVLLTTLASVYPVFALYGLAGVVCAWVAAAMLRRRAGAALPSRAAALWWAGALAAAAVWNAVAISRASAELQMVSRLLGAAGAKAVGPGNILVFPPLVEIFGLVAHAAAAYGSGWRRVPMPILATLGVGCAALAAYGWWRLGRRARIAAAATLLVSAALAAQQRWGVNLPDGYPYGWFKAISALTPQALVLVAAGIAAVWRLRSRRWLAAVAAFVLLAINLKHTLWTQRYVLQDRVVVDRELIGVARAALRIAPGAWTMIDLQLGLRQHWLGYLLRDQLVRYREPLFAWDASVPAAADAFVQYAVVERTLDATRRQELDDPWYQPATYTRLWGNERYELRARRDATVSEQRWARRWPEGAALELGVVPARGTLSVRLAAETRESALGSGTPRTLQVRIFALGPRNRLAVAGLARPIDLRAGGRLLDLDLDLGCAPGERIEIRHLEGDVLLSEVRLLGARTGDPRTCLETAPLATGVAYLEQEVEGARVRLRATVVRPRRAGERIYRLGFHVIDPAQGALFGVWSLDFPPGEPLRRGTLELDLRDRSARAELDGRAAPIVFGSLDTGAGSFEADAVWWQLNPTAQLEIAPMLWFERTAGGTVAVLRAGATPRLKVLPAP